MFTCLPVAAMSNVCMPRSAILGAAGVGLAGLGALKVAKDKKTAARGFEVVDPPAPGSPEFGRLLESLTGSPVRCGNRVEILLNGDQIFPSMVEAIASAQHSIDFSTYIYWTGGPMIGAFGDALVERASAGVQVSILLDAVGSAAKIDRKLVKRLRNAGAMVEWFRPPHWYTLDKTNNRLHRRLLIIDGHDGFTGGVGVGEEWTGDAQDPEHWRETHVRVQGPAVRDLIGGFQENWAETTQRILTGPHLPDLTAFDDGIDVQVTRSSATKGSTDIEELFYSAIAGPVTACGSPPRSSFRPTPSSTRSAQRQHAESTSRSSSTGRTSTKRSSGAPRNVAMTGCCTAARGSSSISRRCCTPRHCW